MGKYQGWTLYNKVKLVINKECYYGYDYPQAYVVDATNKKQLETAINWVTKYSKSGYEVIETDNNGFNLTLLDCAKASSQGGKLSFWNCLVEKSSDNIKCVIGINSELLLRLIKSTSFFNGECTEELSFARCRGEVGLLTYNMKEYKEALNDMQIKKEVNKRKTTKWQVGCNYKTLYLDSLYLGKITKFIKVESAPYGYSKKYNRIAMFEKDKLQNICCSANEIRLNNITRMSELIKLWENNIHKAHKDIVDALNKNRSISLWGLINSMPLLSTSNMGSKLPSRQQGDIQLEIDINIEEEYNRLIQLAQDKVIDIYNMLDGQANVSQYIEYFIIRAGNNDIVDLTDREKTLLYIMSSNNYLDKSTIGLDNEQTYNKEDLIDKIMKTFEEEKDICKK